MRRPAPVIITLSCQRCPMTLALATKAVPMARYQLGRQGVAIPGAPGWREREGELLCPVCLARRAPKLTEEPLDQ